jgi:hypothetical protein
LVKDHDKRRIKIKNFPILMAILSSIILLMIACGPPQPENFMKNSSFEESSSGIPASWSLIRPTGSAENLLCSLSSSEAYDGKYSAFLEMTSPQTASLVQKVTVKPDTLYRLQCRVKTENLETRGLGAYITANAVSNDFSGTTGDWRLAQLIIKTDPGQTELTVGIALGTSRTPVTGTAWFDQFEMREIQDMPSVSLPQTHADAERPGESSASPLGLIILFSAGLLIIALSIAFYIKKKDTLKEVWADLLLAGGLSLAYALIAFFNLGSFATPQTYYKAEKEGESFYVDLGESTAIAKANYFLALGAGSFTIEFSDDLVTWKEAKNIGQESIYSMIEWRTLPINLSARYVRVFAEKPGVMLGEIGLFSEKTGALIRVKTVKSASMRTGTMANPEAVFDEPGRIPSTPSYLNSMYFDETYHARTGYEYILGLDATETTHPPLGKLIISLGMLLFGFTTFGWRFMGTLFGVLMIPVVYCFALRLFKKREWAFFSAFLMAFDFMHFAQTRIATIDVFAVFFIILMFWFMYRATAVHPFEDKLGKLFVPLLLCGVCFGIGASTKWIALYGAVGLFVLFAGYLIYYIVKHIKDYLDAKALLKQKADTSDGAQRQKAEVTVKTALPLLTKRTGLIFLYSLLVFFIIPASIYLAAYIPFMAVRTPGASPVTAIAAVVHEQEFMYSYHATLTATHPFSSSWYEWPLIVKPIWYYTGNAVLPENKVSSIASFGNPAVWWLGIPALAALLVITIARRDKLGLFILMALAAQYVPWIVIPRKLTFIYHFFSSLPFLIFAVTYICKLIVERFPRTRYAIFGYVAIVVILFLMFYPVLSGYVVDKSYVEGYLRWFPSWYF